MSQIWTHFAFWHENNGLLQKDDLRKLFYLDTHVTVNYICLFDVRHQASACPPEKPWQGVMTSAIVDSYEEIAQKLKYILKIKVK